MKVFYLIIVQLFLLFLFTHAQYAQSYFDSDSYAHTINDDQYKIEFHVMPFGKQPAKIRHNRRYAWYAGNQIHFTQGGFSGRLLDGEYIERFDRKGLKVQGKYKKGLIDGQWKIWREDGSLDSVLVYSAGIRNGKFEKYASDGLLQEKGNYSKDLLNGKMERRVGKDSLQIVRYKNGRIYPKRPSKVAIALRKWLPWKKKNSAPDNRLKK